MPRLDESNPVTSDMLCIVLGSEELNNLIRSGTSLDVCEYCYQKLGLSDDVDHPNYEENNYCCVVCDSKLGYCDNYP